MKFGGEEKLRILKKIVCVLFLLSLEFSIDTHSIVFFRNLVDHFWQVVDGHFYQGHVNHSGCFKELMR